MYVPVCLINFHLYMSLVNIESSLVKLSSYMDKIEIKSEFKLQLEDNVNHHLSHRLGKAHSSCSYPEKTFFWSAPK